MSFVPDLKIGEKISNERLMEIFRCGRQGGMRRSLKTNTLVLITDYSQKKYPNAELDENGIWRYSGMGDTGYQSIEYKHNKTLYESNNQKVDLHLFKKEAINTYEYFGKVLLAKEPEYEIDSNQQRNLIIFSLLPIGKTQDVSSFFKTIGFKGLLKEKLIEGGTYYLSAENYSGIFKLMEDYEVNTLIGSDGWFLNDKGYFYNQYSNDKWGKIQDISEKKSLFIGQNKYINPYFRDSLVSNELKNTNEELLVDKEKGKLKIIYLKFKARDMLYEVDFHTNLSKDKDKDKFYTTLIIGPNGTGKSIVLSTVQKIFLDIFSLNISKKDQNTKNLELYELVYKMGKNTYKLKKDNGKLTFEKNYLKTDLKEIELPDRVISCAFNISDRFSTTNSKVLDEYHYLGFKDKKYKDLIQVLTSNVIDAALTNKTFLNDLNNVTRFLGFEDELKIVLPFSKNTNLEKMRNKELVEEILLKNKEKSIGALDITTFWDKYNLVNLINSEGDDDLTFKYKDDRLEIIFSFNESEKYEEMFEEFDLIKKQISLSIFDKPIIKMKKNENWFSIEESSSGEFQYISSMINILTKMKTNSLILLDEPETSLHPNWQYKYLSTLDEIFGKYNCSQFLMATHSHFMVSDLKNDFSSLIELKMNLKNYITSKEITESVYGRSAEDILYEVFNMPTSRNYYLAQDMDEVLKAIGLGEINNEILLKVDKLLVIKEFLKESDPLKRLIEVVNEKVKKNVK